MGNTQTTFLSLTLSWHALDAKIPTGDCLKAYFKAHSPAHGKDALIAYLIIPLWLAGRMQAGKLEFS
jgi:hypothetical protein